MTALLFSKVMDRIEILECSKKSKPYTANYFIQVAQKLLESKEISYDTNLRRPDDSDLTEPQNLGIDSFFAPSMTVRKVARILLPPSSRGFHF